MSAGTIRLGALALVLALATVPGARALAQADGGFDLDADAPDQTEERERLAIIPTIYGDLRRPGAWSVPALAPAAPSGALDWSLARSALAWPADAPPAGDGLPGGVAAPARVERRSDARLYAEQGLGDGICLIATATAARDDRTRASHLGDPAALVQVPLWASRYAGCALALGGAAPLGGANARDWLGDHGSVRGGGWSGCAALAACGGIGLVALQGRLALEATPRGENTVRAADGAIATIRHATARAEAQLAATWRAATWLRLGPEADAWQRRWRARAGDHLGPGLTTMRVEACDLALMAELTPFAGWSVRVEGGVDAAQERLLRARDRLIAGAGLDRTW